MATEQIEFGEYEYRSQGGEIQRRPADREGLTPWQAAWVVVPRDDRPPMVVQHFEQAKDNHSAIY
jgi:hypothetical protein